MSWRTVVGMGVCGLALAAHAAEPSPCKDVPVPGMQSHRIEAQGLGGRAYVYEIGKEHARSVVLVHGLGDIGACDFREHIPWLARSYHVIAVDLPGFAQSDKADAAYSPGSYAAFLKQVADRFVRRPFTLVGHSMGAVVSLRFAALHPKDLTRLVVVDAPGILHRYTYTGQYLSYLGLGFLQSRMADSPMGGTPLPKDAFGKVTEKMNQILGRAEQLNLDPQMVLAIPALRQKALQGDPTRIAGLAVAIEDMSKDIPRIQAETLVIWGKQDSLAPLRTGKLLAHVIPNARLAVIERAGHEPMREAPDRFRDVLEPFLDKGSVEKAPVREPIRRGNAICERKHGTVYEGTYDSLTLNGCRNVLIGNARIRELRVIDSSVAIEDSHIGGGEVGLSASNAVVEMTNGRIEGEVAVSVAASRLDLAGVHVEGRRAAVQLADGAVPAPTGPGKAATPAASIVFSISRVKSPYNDGEVHGYYALASGKPL